MVCGSPDTISMAAALMREGLVDDEVTIVMPGGELSIQKGPEGNLIQRGPAQRVYRAEVELADFEGVMIPHLAGSS